MKLEIEITEEEIKSAMERKVRTAIADQTNQWGVDQFIKETIKKHWREQCEAMILEQLGNSEAMKAKIQSSIEAKLRGQLTAMMREKK